MFFHNGMKVEIVSWPAHKPWPDAVRVGGKVAWYTAWYSCSGGQVVLYRIDGEKLQIGLPRKKLLKEALKCSAT